LISQTSPTVCKQLCYFDCESTGLKPVMDCKIPFIYIAETQRSRMIMSKYSYLLSHERQDSSVCAVQLEYLGRYMHQILVWIFSCQNFGLNTSTPYFGPNIFTPKRWSEYFQSNILVWIFLRHILVWIYSPKYFGLKIFMPKYWFEHFSRQQFEFFVSIGRMFCYICVVVNSNFRH
jgi:hypothetical protein